MSTSHDLDTALKGELKAAGITYADLAGHLGMAESSIKRIFAKGDMPLSRIDEVLQVLKMDFAELARQIADAQMPDTYAISEVDCVHCLLQFDRLGFIELRPSNRYRLKVGKGFRRRPNGPVMASFREHVAADYHYSGGFDGEGETLMLVHGHISVSQAANFVERLQRVGQDFAQQHLADQKLGFDQKRPYTPVVGMRSWLFAACRDLKRVPAAETD